MDGIALQRRLFPCRRSGVDHHQRFFFGFIGNRDCTLSVDVLTIQGDTCATMISLCATFQRPQ